MKLKLLLTGIGLATLATAQSPTVLYAGSGGDLFKSTDGAATWQALHFNDSRIGTVTAVAVDPFASSIVYLAFDTFDPGIADIGIRPGIYVSQASGARLARSQSSPVARVTTLAIDSGVLGVAYAGTAGAGVYRTANFGVDWQPTGLVSGTVTALSTHALRTGTVFASLGADLYTSTDIGLSGVIAGLSMRRAACRSTAANRKSLRQLLIMS